MLEQKKVLLLGLGNDILTDDAIGILVVREARHRFVDHPMIDVHETTEMGLALLDFMANHSAAVIVDSVQTGQAAPGFVHEVDASSLGQLAGRTPHFLGVGETLALGRQLGIKMPEQVKIFAIEVEDLFTLGTQMTSRVQSALPGIVERVTAAVRALV